MWPKLAPIYLTGDISRSKPIQTIINKRVDWYTAPVRNIALSLHGMGQSTR
jgi:hypothetical protein